MQFNFWASRQRRLYRIRREFKRLWKNYLYQSFLATIVVFIVLLLLNMEHAVVIASIGATAFIVFTMPRNITAAPRRVIGGHLIGLFFRFVVRFDSALFDFPLDYCICAGGWGCHLLNGSSGRGTPACGRNCFGSRHHRLFSECSDCRFNQQHCAVSGT